MLARQLRENQLDQNMEMTWRKGVFNGLYGLQGLPE